MKNTLETRVGIFFALALVAAILLVETVGSFDFFQDGMPIRARFSSVQQLQKGDPVKMGGVTIGRVDEIRLAANQVEVRFRITKPEMVKTDSVASISFVGLMGQNYVSISFGSENAPAVTANAELQTTQPADIAQVLSKLDSVAGGVENLTKTFSGDTFTSMLGPFTDFIRENGPRLSAIVTNVQAVSAQIAQGQGTVGKLIMDDELHTLALTTVSNLNTTATEIQSTVGDAREVVDEIRQGKGTLGRLATDDTLYTETTQAMTSLKEILGKINKGQGFAGKLVNDESFYSNIKLTLQKVDKATEGLEDQGPLSVLGVAVNGLF